MQEDQRQTGLQSVTLPMSLPALTGTPLVSVLIASYNYAGYIGQALKSTLGQTYTNVEIVVCDDGSTDHSCSIVEACMSKDRRVCLIRKSNGGHASAINRAFTESHGDIVCILDADDIYYPAKLQKVVDAFKLNTGAGIVTHNLMIIDSADRQNRVASCHPGGYLGPEIPTLRMGLPMPQASGLSFRREVLQQILPLPEEEFRSAADWAIAYAAAYLTYTEHVAEALSGYRIHGSNLSGTTSTAARLTQTMIAKNLECMERVIAFVNRFVQGRFGISVPASRVRNVLEHRLILGILAGEGDSVQLVVDDLRGAFRTVRRDYPFHRYLFWVTLSRLPAGLARALLTLAFYGFSLQGRLKGRLQKARYYSATERVGL